MIETHNRRGKRDERTGDPTRGICAFAFAPLLWACLVPERGGCNPSRPGATSPRHTPQRVRHVPGPLPVPIALEELRTLIKRVRGV
eukprot:scaffold20385_cov121-Isochrysis_galbana.AAC.1